MAVFGKELFDKYKFGKKSTDSGLLFVVSSEDRAYQILTGRGLEGTLPDAICKRIGYRIIEPLLKDDKWDEGVAMGVTSLARVIHEDQEFVEALNDDDDDIWGIGLGLGGFFTAIGLAFAAAHYSRPKCQRCGKRMNQERKLLVNKTRSAKFYSVTYRCPHCHNEMTRTERYEIESTTTVAPMFGGRGFGGGGGSMGGSFGGGSFGGGGAGGRF